MSRLDNRAEQPAEAAGHPGCTIHSSQLIRRFHSIEQGHSDCVRPNQWAHGCNSLRNLPGLHGQQHDVHRADGRRVVRGVNGIHDEVTIDTVHPQARLPQRLQVRATRHKRDIFP